ncbi:hypothetical protein ACWDSJ_13115 [Nocardia sp. NPDC003482]
MPFLVAVTTGFQPVGMIKTAPQQLTASFGPIINWTADPAYPGSVVTGSSNNQLRALGTKPGAKVEVSLPFSGGAAGFNGTISQQARLLINSVVVLTGDPVSGTGSGTLTITTTLDINAGDLVSVEAVCTATGLNPVLSSIAVNPVPYVRIS